MLTFIHDNTKVIAISISFFTFGYVLGTNAFDLAPRETMTVLIAGAACGITALMTEYSNSKKRQSAIRARLS
jgi:hypothetical protein